MRRLIEDFMDWLNKLFFETKTYRIGSTTITGTPYIEGGVKSSFGVPLNLSEEELDEIMGVDADE